KQSSMPRSATLDGCVDYILSPREISGELMRIAQHPYAKEAGPGAEQLSQEVEVGEIVGLLRTSTNVDFSHFKQTTIQRRILRRMALLGLDNVDDYLSRLRADHAEVRNLYQDFLIRVTQFFRDQPAFEALKTKVFPVLVKDRPPSAPIRV